jgi:TonB family protein
MKAIPLSILILVLLAGTVLAQDPLQAAVLPSAPVVWERYKIDKQRVTFLFPKLPTVIANVSSCSEVERWAYYTYTEGAVYTVAVFTKSKYAEYSFCSSVEKFSSGLFDEELKKIRSEMPEASSASQDKDGRKVFKFSGPAQSLYLYDDLENKRWVKVSILHRKDAKLNDEFLDSIRFESHEGKPIGDGAERTLGDPNFQTVVSPATDTGKSDGESKTITAVSDPVMIIAKPRAAYTDEARQANIQGSVRLRVSLYANGSVGSITPVTTLKYGLTEQAIVAAKKLVFLPKRINGVPVSVTTMFEYNFRIY